MKQALNCHLQLSLNREPLKIKLPKIDTSLSRVHARRRHCMRQESEGIFGKTVFNRQLLLAILHSQYTQNANRVPSNVHHSIKAENFYLPSMLICH